MAVGVGWKSSFEHLLEELQRIDLMIRAQIVRFRMTRKEGADEFHGLCLKEDEVDALLASGNLFSADRAQEFSQLQSSLRDSLSALEAQMAQKQETALQEGVVLRLEQLKRFFQLSDFDVDVLLVGLAPELDLRYEKLYAYLQDDIARKRPNIHLVLEILCPTLEAKVAARAHFAPTAPLIFHQLLHVANDASESHIPLLAKSLKVDDRIVEYLMGSDQPDTRLLPIIQWREPALRWQDLILPEEVKSRIAQLVTGQMNDLSGAVPYNGRLEGLIFYFQGPAGVGKRVTAECLCHELKMPLLVIDTARILNSDLPIPVAVRTIFREAILRQSALYFKHFDLLLAEEEKVRPYREMIIEALEHFWGLIFLAGCTDWKPTGAWCQKAFIRVEFPAPSHALRKQLLELFLGDNVASPLDVGAVSSKFRLNAGQIRDAVATAKNLALWRDPGNGHLTDNDLYSAFRVHSNQKLGSLAMKVSPAHTWNDIVLPKEQRAQLHEVVNAVKHRHVVHEVWGFQRKLALGKGLNILFAGLSGTGKTMAAGLISRELGLDLYKIDLSMVVSKYIGETEKNLARIFAEAETSNAVLFFDEADALFGKRSEVKDAHDRYANMETAYLLQKMEEYEGIVILATNLKKNMDDAFVRRMSMTLEFPFPEEEDRCRIWKGIFPKEAPLSADIDFPFLARQFNLAGGNIKNIALCAAFMAADNGQVINMAHLIRAAKREFQKMGRLLSSADFLGYYNLVTAGEDSVERAGENRK